MIIIKIRDRATVALHKTTHTTAIAVHQTSNKAETLQTNNCVDIATEQITKSETVKLVSTAEDWDTCLKSVEHYDRIRIGVASRTTTKTIRTCAITTKTTTLTAHSNEIL